METSLRETSDLIASSLARDVDVAGFVLAGGQSARMGTDKALVPLAGQPLVVHALTILREAGLRGSIAGARATLDSFAPVIEDSEQDQGPLGGICSALASTETRWAVFLPIDLPLLPTALLAFLLARAQRARAAISVVETNGIVQTFPAVIERSALSGLRAALTNGYRGCFSAFQTAARDLGQTVMSISLKSIIETAQVTHPAGLPADCWFLNINSPADLARAQMLLERSLFAPGQHRAAS